MTMKYLTLLLLAVSVLAGCAQNAYFADREHGVATNDAFDQQIVNKDYVYAGKTSDSMDGIYAEPILETYYNSFSEGFTIESINTLSPSSE